MKKFSFDSKGYVEKNPMFYVLDLVFLISLITSFGGAKNIRTFHQGDL